MPLTYQPFAESPSVHELSRDLHMNVPDRERVLSGFVGSFLAAAAISRHDPIRWLLLAAGAALVGRAWTGYCAVYRGLDTDPRHATSGDAKNQRTHRLATDDPAQEDYELRYSALELDVPPEELRKALQNVRPVSEP